MIVYKSINQKKINRKNKLFYFFFLNNYISDLKHINFFKIFQTNNYHNSNRIKYFYEYNYIFN